MEINYIKKRLERILFATNSRIDEDFIRHAKIDSLEQGVKVTLPGVDDPIKIENDIYAILHHLATFKDHLKNHLELNGHDKRIIEREIDSSIYLKVLIDLVNAEKHGYPTKSNRSGKNPVIRNFAQSLKNNNDGKPIVALLGTKGEINVIDGKYPSVELYAKIYDEHGNFLYGFDDLVEKCYNQWLNLAEKYS